MEGVEMPARVVKRTCRTTEGHLLWTGALANGYPAIKNGSETVYVKRLIWEQLNGPIPAGMVVVSACGHRTCVEPRHLALSRPGRYAGKAEGENPER